MGHTNETWIVKQGPHGEFTDIYSDECPDCLATTAMMGWSRAEREEHAAFIVTACNSHDDLLAACEEALFEICNHEAGHQEQYQRVYRVLEAARDKARKEK